MSSSRPDVPDPISVPHLQPPELLPYRVAKCQELGRYLEATRDLKKGEIIFQEFPLAIAPQKTSSLICPGCFKTTNVQCTKCGWPLCSENCPEIHRHSEIECKILYSIYDDENKEKEAKKKEIRFNDERNWNLLQDTLMVIRCLFLKYSNKGKWNKLLDMDPNWERWSSSPLYEHSMNLVKTIIRKEYHISEDLYETEEIMKILSILDTNAYEIKMPDVNIQGVYKLASLAEHNCTPNSIKTTSSESLVLTLRAAKDIPKGSHISTSYCDILWTTCQRQRYIQWSKFFVCQCDRCLSPTELNSHISSFLCPNCPLDTPLIPDFKSEKEILNKQTLWTELYKNYHCLSCGSEFQAKTCDTTVTKAELELQEIEKKDGENVANFEDWLQKWTIFPASNTAKHSLNYSKEVCNMDGNPTLCSELNDKNLSFTFSLHPQHALCLDACHTAFLLYSTNTESMDELKRKTVLGIHLLQATSNLFADISMFRGTVMYELAITKTSLLTRYINNKEENVSNLRALAKEILRLMSESLEILKYEAEDQPEGQLFTLAFKQFEDLCPFLQEMISDDSDSIK